MAHNRLVYTRITWLTLFFTLLIMPPLLSLVNKPVRVAGIPLLYAYLFVVWLLFVLAIALLLKKTDP